MIILYYCTSIFKYHSTNKHTETCCPASLHLCPTSKILPYTRWKVQCLPNRLVSHPCSPARQRRLCSRLPRRRVAFSFPHSDDIGVELNIRNTVVRWWIWGIAKGRVGLEKDFVGKGAIRCVVVVHDVKCSNVLKIIKAFECLCFEIIWNYFCWHLKQRESLTEFIIWNMFGFQGGSKMTNQTNWPNILWSVRWQGQSKSREGDRYSAE